MEPAQTRPHSSAEHHQFVTGNRRKLLPSPSSSLRAGPWPYTIIYVLQEANQRSLRRASSRETDVLLERGFAGRSQPAPRCLRHPCHLPVSPGASGATDQ